MLYADSLERLDYIGAENLSVGHDGPDAVAEMTPTTCCSVTYPITRRYVYGAGADEPLVWYEGSGTTDKRWLHADERGSVITASSASGSALTINSYDEYGNEASSVPAYRGRFGYTGQAWLPSLGLNYYKARMYSPSLGRFLQTDPLGYDDGLNWYNYVDSDPVDNTDPSGLASLEAPKSCTPDPNPAPADAFVCGIRPELPNLGDLVLGQARSATRGTVGRDGAMRERRKVTRALTRMRLANAFTSGTRTEN